MKLISVSVFVAMVLAGPASAAPLESIQKNLEKNKAFGTADFGVEHKDGAVSISETAIGIDGARGGGNASDRSVVTETRDNDCQGGTRVTLPGGSSGC